MQSPFVRLILAAVTTFALLSFAPVSEALHSIFQTIDQNEDGKIDRREFTKNTIEHVFNRLDDNDSNVITSTEWDNIENVHDREKHDELFKVMDTDKDRMISFVEFSNYAEKHSNIEGAFASLDKDKDGVLVPDEISARPPFSMVTIQF